MSNTYQIYLISDSTGETLDRIFLALKAQFLNIEYKVHSYSFTRTENQILKILEDAKKNENSIILYTIVDNNLAKYLANTSEDKNIPCFGVLGNLILNFSKIFSWHTLLVIPKTITTCSLKLREIDTYLITKNYQYMILIQIF